MRKNRADDVLQYAITHDEKSWAISDCAIATDISERQVRNYIHELNVTYTNPIILSSHGKYSLVPDYKSLIQKSVHDTATPAQRQSIIINRLLLAHESINAYDLSDELYISRSTLDGDLKKISPKLDAYSLSLKIKGDELSLAGTESNKRKLTGALLKEDHYDLFNSSNIKKYGYDVSDLSHTVYEIFQKYQCHINDYALNNIVMHLAVTIDRIKNNCLLHNQIPQHSYTDLQESIVSDIIGTVSSKYQIAFNSLERRNMLLFISCNMPAIDYTLVNKSELEKYIPANIIEVTARTISHVQDAYDLEPFDEVFMSRFTIHVYNLFLRASNHFNAINPLKDELQLSYPLVYDIALYVSSELQKQLHISIVPDEISFITFHIGSYFETSMHNSAKLTALYIYRDYYEMYMINISKLSAAFDNTVHIKYIMSLHDYQESKQSSDLLFSEIPLNRNEIIIPTFLKESDIEHIRLLIEKQKAEKEKESQNTLFQELIKERLWFQDIDGTDEFEVIDHIVNKVISAGFASNSFRDELYERERLSCTAFDSGVAIPHSLHQNVRKSFISVTCYHQPIKWGTKRVSMVVMIGISHEERKKFRRVFNALVKIMTIKNNVLALSSCNTYGDFIKTLETSMIL